MATREERTADKATNERNQRILKEIVKRPENRKCADCKTKDSRWASLNLGVFICLTCSGIHRAMGTHISKVRSVDLDAWTTEQVDKIEKIGNLKANQYWEAALPQSHVPDFNEIERFIRNKYERKLYVSAAPVQNNSAATPKKSNTVAPSKETKNIDLFEPQALQTKQKETSNVKYTLNAGQSNNNANFSQNINASVPAANAPSQGGFADFSKFSIKPPVK